MISSWTRLWKEKKKGSLSVECIWKRCLKQLFPPPSTKHRVIKFFKTPLGFGKYITCNRLHWTFGTFTLLSSSLKQVLFFIVWGTSHNGTPLLCQARSLTLGRRTQTGTHHAVCSVCVSRSRVGKENRTTSATIHHAEKVSRNIPKMSVTIHILVFVELNSQTQGNSAYGMK